jgi:RNA polymerase sigma-70 factor (ECF subfamily)
VSVARFFQNKVSEAAREDLVHETFLACLTGATRFRGDARFRTFLFGIAHHVLAEHLRRTGRRCALGSETDIDETPVASSELSPIATVVQHQERQLLLEALRRIPLAHQIALELHYWEDLTAAEIGDVLGVPLGTIKTRLRDGRIHLQEQLRKLSHASETPRHAGGDPADEPDDLDQWARRVRARIFPGIGHG